MTKEIDRKGWWQLVLWWAFIYGIILVAIIVGLVGVYKFSTWLFS